MTYLFAPEHGVKYVLTGPTGQRAVFNDPDDADYVGMLTSVTGLDGAEIRESTEDLVERDGGMQGPNFYAKRPVVLEGISFGHTTLAQRNERLQKLAFATNAMRADATLTWTPSGGDALTIKLRRQQRLNISGGWNKTFQVGMVAADPRIYSSALQSALINQPGNPTTGVSVVNSGIADTFPVLALMGPMTTPTIISNSSSGMYIKLIRDVGTFAALVIDTLAQSAVVYDRDIVTTNAFRNPSFEQGTNLRAVAGTGATSITRVAQPSPSSGFGSNVLRIIADGSSTEALAVLQGTLSGDHVLGPSVPVATLPGKYIQVSFSALSGQSTARQAWAKFEFRTTSGGSIINTQTASLSNLSNSAWTRVASTPILAPVGGNYCQISIGAHSASGNITSTHFWYVDGVMIEVRSDAGFTDSTFRYPGLTPGAVWSSTTDDSVSYILDLAPNLSSVISPGYSYIDYSTIVWAGFPPGSSVYEANPTNDGVGNYATAEWRHAWL